MGSRNGDLSHHEPPAVPCRHTPENECVLADAVDEGGRTLLETLLRTFGNGDEQFGCREYALQAALVAGAQDAVELIIRWGVDMDLIGGLFETPLQAAIFGGHIGMVELVLQRGAAVDAETAIFSTPLLAAITWGRHDIVSALLEHGADVNRAADRQQHTPLQLASAEGMPAIIITLLGHGADVNTKGGPHGNAFQAAISNGHLSQDQISKGIEVSSNKMLNSSACDDGTTSRYLQAVSVLSDAIRKAKRIEC